MGIQWMILQQQFIATIGTVLAMVLLLFAGSFIITEMTPWESTIEAFLGLSFYSFPYFLILGIIMGLGMMIAFFVTIFIGYPLGKALKKHLQKITDGAEAFSRGKLDHRIKSDGFTEITRVGQQFNKMADRIEKQVNTLQRLVDENVRLVNQTKLTTALDERRKLARELHDAVSQELFAISMTLSALPRLMESDMDKAKAHFIQVEEMVVNAQQELRALIMHLRPVTLEGNMLYEGIQKLLEELQQKHPQINWEWNIDDQEPLTPGVEDQLFRVFQEAISNMLRHSKATNFRLHYLKREERIILTIEDNGIGFTDKDKKKSSYGIDNMRERIEDIGGRFDLISYPSKGTRIEIRVPIKLS